jgi:hypothetical protein
VRDRGLGDRALLVRREHPDILVAMSDNYEAAAPTSSLGTSPQRSSSR